LALFGLTGVKEGFIPTIGQSLVWPGLTWKGVLFKILTLKLEEIGGVWKGW